MPLPERIEGECPKRVRVVAPGEYHGVEGTVSVVYYDRLHTGDSYDHLTVSLDDGRSVGGPANLFEAVIDREAAGEAETIARCGDDY